MNTDLWIDRLYNDESLTDNLTDTEADRILRWGASSLAVCDNDEDAEKILVAIRWVNRRAAEGIAFEDLFAAVRDVQTSESSGSNGTHGDRSGDDGSTTGDIER